MSLDASPTASEKPVIWRQPAKGSANAMVEDYLEQGCRQFKDLRELLDQVSKNRKADKYFQEQRESADNADSKRQTMFFIMMRRIAFELNAHTNRALEIKRAADSSPNTADGPAVLDLCMAPGGFASAVLSLNPRAHICGISLPPSQGGHEMLLRDWQNDSRVDVHFTDITMMAGDMGVHQADEIPADHPARDTLLAALPHFGPLHQRRFDLVFCDGQVLRTHVDTHRHAYRRTAEATRLLTSQLVLALSRVRIEGTVVVLLHRSWMWLTMRMVHAFSRFAKVELYKPTAAHGLKASFYLVATMVRPYRAEARRAVADWQAQWRAATFDGTAPRELWDPPPETVEGVLREFGDSFIELAKPVWQVQAEALGKASFMSSESWRRA